MLSQLEVLQASSEQRPRMLNRTAPTIEKYMVQNATVWKPRPVPNLRAAQGREDCSLRVVEASYSFAELSQCVQAHIASQC